MEIEVEPNVEEQSKITNQYFQGFSEGNKIAGFVNALLQNIDVELTSSDVKDLIIAKINYELNLDLTMIDAEVKLAENSSGECDCNKEKDEVKL